MQDRGDDEQETSWNTPCLPENRCHNFDHRRWRSCRTPHTTQPTASANLLSPGPIFQLRQALVPYVILQAFYPTQPPSHANNPEY